MICRTESGSVRSAHEAGDHAWVDEQDGSIYSLRKTDPKLHTTAAEVNSPFIQVVYQGDNAYAIWRIGSNVICKVTAPLPCSTPESDTLAFVQRQCPSFETPKVIYYNWYDDRSFLFHSRLPGRTLDSAWATLSEEKRDEYADAVADIIEEMAEWKGSEIGQVNGGQFPSNWLLMTGLLGYTILGKDLSMNLKSTCRGVGMDCSDLVFQHEALAPLNIIVEEEPEPGTVSLKEEPKRVKVGLINFEAASYLPRDWIRTQCAVSGGLDLWNLNPPDCAAWRKKLGRVLASRGFNNLTDGFLEWHQRIATRE